jgi:hypothetical protein
MEHFFRFVFLEFIWLPKPILTSDAEETKKFWTFKMVWSIADRCMTESVSHSRQFLNFPVQRIRFGQKQRSIDVRPFGSKHFTNLIERETSVTPQSD